MDGQSNVLEVVWMISSSWQTYVMFSSRKIFLHKLHPLAKKVASQSHFMWQAMAWMSIPPLRRGNNLNFGCMGNENPSHELRLIPKGTCIHVILKLPNIISKNKILTILFFETMRTTTS